MDYLRRSIVIEAMTEDQLCREIEKGLEDVREGRLTSAEDFEAELKEKYGI